MSIFVDIFYIKIIYFLNGYSGNHYKTWFVTPHYFIDPQHYFYSLIIVYNFHMFFVTNQYCLLFWINRNSDGVNEI